MIKTYAGYFNDKKEWIPQRNVVMHPLEEAEINCHYACNSIQAQIPAEPTTDDKLAWILSGGNDFANKKMAEWQAQYNAAQPRIEAAMKAHQVAHKAWCDHVKICAINKIDPDRNQ